MRKDIRIAICLVGIILLVILCIYRLLADKEIEDDGKQNPEISSAVPTPRVIVDPKGTNSDILQAITYYIVDVSEKNTKPVEAVVGKKEEITPEHIIEYITDDLEDEEIEISIEKVLTEGNLCIVDFNEVMIGTVEKNPELEKLILDAIAKSLLDNLQDVNEVSFRIAGKPYKTSTFELKDKEGYLGK